MFEDTGGFVHSRGLRPGDYLVVCRAKEGHLVRTRTIFDFISVYVSYVSVSDNVCVHDHSSQIMLRSEYEPRQEGSDRGL